MARLCQADIDAIADATAARVIDELPSCPLGMTHEEVQGMKGLLTMLVAAKKAALVTIVTLIITSLLGLMSIGAFIKYGA